MPAALAIAPRRALARRAPLRPGDDDVDPRPRSVRPERLVVPDFQRME